MGRFVGLLVVALIGPILARPAQAERIQNAVAVFAALDKVTGRISHLDIPMNETVQFGALKVTPRVCNTRPPTEPPHTDAFVEVDEIKLSGEIQRIFTGWMFAESPGLHAVEHPVFDVWLTKCNTSAPVAPDGSSENAEATAPPDGSGAPPAEPGATPPPGTEAAAVAEEPAPLPDRKPKKPAAPVVRPAPPPAPAAPPPPAPGGFWNRF
jgi:hypothetical protein